MIIQFEKETAPENKANALKKIASLGYKYMTVSTQNGEYLVCVGKKEFDIRQIGQLPGVADVHRVSDDYKLVSRKWKVQPTEIDLGDGVRIRRGEVCLMAGPCSIESEEQVERMVGHLVENGVKIMRGGVFKPRSSPYSFRGMGIDGLKMFYKICRERGIKIITEVMDAAQIDPMLPFVDIFQVGARNSQNFTLLDGLGRVDKPVLIKRGMSGTIEELLQAAEYVFSNGNEKIILCERGIRTYEQAYRNSLDLNVVPILKDKTHLPVMVDPSHGIGIRKYVPAMALAAVMAGADGLLLEVHETPEKAASDGQQTLDFAEAAVLYNKVRTAEKLNF